MVLEVSKKVELDFKVNGFKEGEEERVRLRFLFLVAD